MSDAAARPSRPGWLFGPLPDLLVGCGLAYVAVFGLLVVVGPPIQSAVPLGALVLGTLFVGTPHYGATLLRVYERSEDRRRYTLFAVWASVLLAVLFVGGLHSAELRSWINTVYLTWSPYHYTGQNYGIALMLAGRAGIALLPAEKRVVHANFLLSFLLIFLASHGDSEPVSYAPQVDRPDNVRFVSLGIPFVARNALLLAAGVAYLVTMVGSVRALLRHGTLRAVAPTLCLFGTQALWFSLPALARATGALPEVLPLSRDFAVYSFLWIAYGHSFQYLWVTAYDAKRRGAAGSHGAFYLKSLLAGATIWGLPALLFMPDALGPLAHEAGLALMIGACVNLHHFVLDGAIWKLRDGRVARILLRGATDAPAPDATPTRHWLRNAVFAVGAACVAINLTADWEWYFAYKPALERKDVARIEQAGKRLRAVGRESPALLGRLGELHLEGGRQAPALAALERSVALRPNARTWGALGDLHAEYRRPKVAAEAYLEATQLAPNSVRAHYRAGIALWRSGQLERARSSLARAVEIDPSHPGARDSLTKLDALLAERDA